MAYTRRNFATYLDITPRHNLAADPRLLHVVNPTLVYVGILVDHRDRVRNRVVVKLCFVVIHVKLHLGRILYRAAQLVGKNV